MEYIRGTREFQIEEPTAVTLGKFDGLHRGHKKLLEELFRFRKKGCKTAVFTFETAPGTLIRKKLQTMITTNEERYENLRDAGVDYLVEYPFNQQVASMSPEEFVVHVLKGQMNAEAIVVGTDFHFGRNRSGDVAFLKANAEKFRYDLTVVEKAMDGEREISSTYIREELAAGRIEKANELLGYTYSIQGRVVHGKHLGTGMGFPTVNLLPPSQKHLPAFGVYLSEVEIDGKLYPGITNIGRKPTIKGEHPAGVETHIYDWTRDIYGKDVKVRFLTFMRPERKFDSVEDLKAQVLHDKEEGRIWHQNRP